jgi:hypothetical protein
MSGVVVVVITWDCACCADAAETDESNARPVTTITQ